MTENKESSNIFEGLESWKAILEKADVYTPYNKVCDIANVRPPKKLILECFRYFRPQDMKVLLLAQDPYPADTNSTPDACGLAFGTTGSVPKSLVNIYDNFENNGICKGFKRDGYFKSYAAQGVLCLNTALTTIKGESKVHTSVWKSFTAELLKQLNEFPQELTVLLWGSDAKSFSKYFTNRRHIIRTWTHPSPLGDNKLPEHLKFKNCDHFKLTKCIDWNPEQKIMVWTDGACSGNGTDKAIAGFATMLLGGYMGKTVISGRVRTGKYSIMNDAIICDEKMSAGNTPTNNRGELLAVIYGLWAIDRSYIRGEIEMICDSEYAINTVEDFYPKRLAKGTAGELQNIDLLEICYGLLTTIRKHSKLEIIHTRSHQKLQDNADSRTECIHAGNSHIDSVAVNAKDYKDFDLVIDTKLPALLKYKKT